MSELLSWSSIYKLASNLSFLLMLMSIMIISGNMKAKRTLEPVYSVLVNTRWIKSRKALLGVLTAIYGLLPVPSRVSVAAALLDTMVDKRRDNSKMGVLVYIATHHYYLWSPLEKSVMMIMAGLSLEYHVFVSHMAWPLLVSFLTIVTYISICISDRDVHGFAIYDKVQMSWSKRIDFMLLIMLIALNAMSIPPNIKLGQVSIEGMTWSCVVLATWLIGKHLPSREELAGYINWKLISFATGVVILGWVTGAYGDQIHYYVDMIAHGYGIWLSLLVAFVASLILGSSARYAAITVVLTQVFGMKYFMLFFTVEYIGYLLSPAHKCVCIGQQYFNTKPSELYAIIGVMCLAMLGGALVFTFAY